MGGFVADSGMYSFGSASFNAGSALPAQDFTHHLSQSAHTANANRAAIALTPGLLGQSPQVFEEQPPTPSSTGGGTQNSICSAEKGSAISLLQEFIQCSREFRTPSKRSILHWRFDERVADNITLEFRATVAFLLDGIAHHAIGDWRTSKRLAKLDAAERALCLFVGSWGQQLVRPEAFGAQMLVSSGTDPDDVNDTVPEVRELEDYCKRMPVTGGEAPQWSDSWEGNHCQAMAELNLMGVPHVLQGPAMPSQREARAETAKRILWYLQCPGYEDEFVPDPDAPAATETEIPAPPKNWNSDVTPEEIAAQVERKTALVRIQNRVQQHYARLLKPGQRVWEWSYEHDSDVEHMRHRASVRIPVAGETFVSDWHKIQRDAQFDACAKVASFLDGPMEKSPSSRA